MGESKLIVVTGPDGSGKSTICERVHRSLSAEKGEGFLEVASVWDSIAASGVLTKPAAVSYLSGLKGTARAWFIFHSLRNSIDLAKKKNPAVILIDGFFYKYLVSERAYRTSPEVLEGIAPGFEAPDRVFFLEVSPETAWARKGTSSAYEGGGTAVQREDFLKFQALQARLWDETEKKYGPWTHLPCGPAAEEHADRIAREICATVTPN